MFRRALCFPQQGSHSGLKNTTSPNDTRKANATPTVAPTVARVLELLEEPRSAGGAGGDDVKELAGAGDSPSSGAGGEEPASMAGAGDGVGNSSGAGDGVGESSGAGDSVGESSGAGDGADAEAGLMELIAAGVGASDPAVGTARGASLPGDGARRDGAGEGDGDGPPPVVGARAGTTSRRQRRDP